MSFRLLQLVFQILKNTFLQHFPTSFNAYRCRPRLVRTVTRLLSRLAVHYSIQSQTLFLKRYRYAAFLLPHPSHDNSEPWLCWSHSPVFCNQATRSFQRCSTLTLRRKSCNVSSLQSPLYPLLDPNSNIECRSVNARPRASTREASLTWTTSQPVDPTVARRRKMKTRLTYRCQSRILDVQLGSGPRCAKPEELAFQCERRPHRKNYIKLLAIDHRVFKYARYVLYHTPQFLQAYLIPRSTDFPRLRLMWIVIIYYLRGMAQ